MHEYYHLENLLYIYILLVCPSVCPFVSNPIRQNGRTDRAQTLCGTHDPREELWMLKITKFCVSKVFDFCEILKMLEIKDGQKAP